MHMLWVGFWWLCGWKLWEVHLHKMVPISRPLHKADDTRYVKVYIHQWVKSTDTRGEEAFLSTVEEMVNKGWWITI